MTSLADPIANYAVNKVNINIGTSVVVYTLPTTISSFNTTITSVDVSSNEYIYITGTNFTDRFSKVTFNSGSVLASDVNFINTTTIQVKMISVRFFIYNVTISYSNNTNAVTYNVVTGANNDKVLISPMLERVLSNICFPAKTPITTDQGDIPIEQINQNIHTIRGKKIIGVTKTVTQETYLVCFEPDALGENMPNQTTVISQNHLILYKDEMIRAKEFIDNFANVYKIKYNGEVLYNVLMEEHDTMIVNNLICETLDPENGTAKIYGILETLPQKEQHFVIEKMNELVIKHDVFNNVNSK
jgi:hypothetical protein